MDKELLSWNNLLIKAFRFFPPAFGLSWGCLSCLYNNENKTQGSRWKQESCCQSSLKNNLVTIRWKIYSLSTNEIIALLRICKNQILAWFSGTESFTLISVMWRVMAFDCILRLTRLSYSPGMWSGKLIPQLPDPSLPPTCWGTGIGGGGMIWPKVGQPPGSSALNLSHISEGCWGVSGVPVWPVRSLSP